MVKEQKIGKPATNFRKVNERGSTISKSFIGIRPSGRKWGRKRYNLISCESVRNYGKIKRKHGCSIV